MEYTEEDLSKFYPITYRDDLIKGYEINKKGEIKNPKGNILFGGKDYNGYKIYNVEKLDGSRAKIFAHIAVAKQFIPNNDNYKIVNHIDENKMNPYINNLEWTTSKENSNYGTGNKRRIESRKIPINEYNLDGIYIRTWECAQTIGKYFEEFSIHDKKPKSTAKTITSCCQNLSQTAYGKIWKYYEGNTDNIDLSYSNVNSKIIFDVQDVPSKYLYKFHTKEYLINYFLTHERLTMFDIRMFKELINTFKLHLSA